MEQYKLKHGYHFSGGKQYGAGDIVKSKNNLAKLFPDRFTGIREEVVITTPPAKVEKPIVVAQQADTTDEELEDGTVHLIGSDEPPLGWTVSFLGHEDDGEDGIDWWTLTAPDGASIDVIGPPEEEGW